MKLFVIAAIWFVFGIGVKWFWDKVSKEEEKDYERKYWDV